MRKFRFNTSAGYILCNAKLANKRQSAFIKLVVDTGASSTMISVESALAIGIDPFKSTHRIEVTTAGGIIVAHIVRIPIIKCFGIEVKNLDAICHNLPPESPVEGLLGLNFLAQAKLIIDFFHNTIIIPE